MEIFKKTTAIILALTLTIGMSINTLAATAGWTDYLGFDGKKGHTWYEAADGTITNIKKTGWTANLTQIGWGGIWGAQMSRKIKVKKGTKYNLKFKIKSTGCDKWVFVKIATKEKYAYGKWIWLTNNEYQTINVTFKAKKNANTITFAFGGEYGDREATNGTKHYAYAGGAKKIAAKKDAGGDSGSHNGTFTRIILKKYSLKKISTKVSTKKKCNCNCPCCK